MNLRLYQIHPGDLLADGMLHLHPGVGFHKEVAAGVRLHQKFEGANTQIVHLGGQSQSTVDNAIPQGRIQPRCRGKLHQLLVTALQGTVALPQMAHRAAAIAQHLHFNMPGGGHQLLHIHRVVAKGRFRLRLTTLKSRFQCYRVSNRSHTAATAAAQGLDHHATAIEGRHKGLRLLQRHRLRGALHQRHLTLRRQRPGRRLVAKQPQRLRPRPDQGQPRFGTLLGKLRVFRQKAITGMNRLTPLLPGNRDQLRPIQIRRHPTPRQRHRLIHLTDMQRCLIILRKHPHGANPQIRTGIGNTNSNLATVGDQDGSKRDGHGGLQS